MKNLIITVLLSIVLLSCNESRSTKSVEIKEQVTVLESSISYSKSKEIMKSLLHDHVMVTCAYEDNCQRIVAIVNDEEFEYEDNNFALWPKKLKIVIAEKESKVFVVKHLYPVNMNLFYGKLKNKDNYDITGDEFILFEFDEDSEVFQLNGSDYLFVHISRSIGGNAIADILHDFLACNLDNGKIYSLIYLENMEDPDTDNGELYEMTSYPEGVKEYLQHKLESNNTIKKVK